MSVSRREELVKGLIEIGSRIWSQRFLAGTDGNLSARLSETEVLITRSNVCKGYLKPSDFSVVSLEGKLLEGQKASTETAMHLRVYQRRPDVQVVVHAHPPTATAYACCGLHLAGDFLPEVVYRLGTVPLASFAMPGTNELADSLDPLVEKHDSILLENHGVISYGHCLEDAVGKLETVEMAAEILLKARQLGIPKSLPKRALMALRGMRVEAAQQQS